MMVHADIIKVFAAAMAAAPSVVFIDDADIVIGGWRPLDGGRGSDIFRFLLGHMDGLTSRGDKQKGDVVVMLTGQNVKWMAGMLLRSGRIELWLKTKLPGPKEKREILKKYIKEDPGALELLGKDGEVPDVRDAATASDQYNCADLRRVVNDAKILAAWARRKGAAENRQVKEGKEYLTDAAEALRDMKNDVEEAMRKMYC
jgi:SpoVK/Ycf46/Vps4 family AAA+-type ATPase